MFSRTIATAALALAAAQAPALAAEGWSDNGRDTAIAACIDRNEYQPAKLSAVAEDGLGDFVVWVEDKDGDLWLCNAGEDGEVYANVYLEGDLLGGEGAQLISNDASSQTVATGPAGRAENLCAAVEALVEDLEIVATVDDALGDYLVWLQNADDVYWMCNASADGKLYTFELVEYPLEEQTADVAGEATAGAERGA